jgi:uncharacterized protein
MSGWRIHFLAIVAVTTFLLSGIPATDGSAQSLNSFRVGTGGHGGTYYPIGRSIGEGVSKQSMSNECSGDDCPPRILLIAQTSNGSVANLAALMDGSLEGGFAQANIVHWSYTGTGLFHDQDPQMDIRAIANLYPESVHLIASTDSSILKFHDIRGHRVSLDEPGSGTLVDTGYLLEAFGISNSDFRTEYMKPDLAIERVKEGTLDAFFAVAGAPIRALESSDLLQSGDFRIVDIAGPEITALLSQHPFYTKMSIPEDTYIGHPRVETVGVGAQFVTHARIPDDIIYEITRLLWSDQTRVLLDSGHGLGQAVRFESALDGLSIPLHPGAARYYREQGLID